MDNRISFPCIPSTSRLVQHCSTSVALHNASGTTVKGILPMKHIWAVILVLVFAIGMVTYTGTASPSLRWVPLITGSILIVAAVLTALGLRFSGFGRWFLGRLWPGQFSAGKQRRVATRLALVLLLAYILWGTGTLLGSLAGTSASVEHLTSTLTVLGVVGAGGTLWAQAVCISRYQ
jgi:hypothetical protein